MKLEFNQSQVTIHLSASKFETVSDHLFSTEEPKGKHTIHLSEKEHYFLSLLMGCVEPDYDVASSVMKKLAELEDIQFNIEDYNQIKFKQDTCGETVIQYVEENE